MTLCTWETLKNKHLSDERQAENRRKAEEMLEITNAYAVYITCDVGHRAIRTDGFLSGQATNDAAREAFKKSITLGEARAVGITLSDGHVLALNEKHWACSRALPIETEAFLNHLYS